MRIVLALLALAAAILAGCVAPQPHLWKNGAENVPASFEVRTPLTFTDGKTHESFLVPAGTYALWYQNKFGYHYRLAGAKIQHTDAKGIVHEFEGGLELAKRVDIISVYQLVRLGEDYDESGDLSRLSAWEAGDKDGFVRKWTVNLPRHFYPALGFPEYQMPGTDR